MYSDHEFVSDTKLGTNQGMCAELVDVYNPDFDHYMVDKWIEVWATDEMGNPTWGKTDPTAPCQECNRPAKDKIHSERVLAACNRSWTSVVHPPDQFRHWCSILEQGGDCMHFED